MAVDYYVGRSTIPRHTPAHAYHPALALLISRMIRIERHAVDATAGHIAVYFLVLFKTIVARLTERLKLAEHEGVYITAMWNHVVDDRGRLDLALLLAEPAKGLDRQLILTQALPLRTSVQIHHCLNPHISIAQQLTAPQMFLHARRTIGRVVPVDLRRHAGSLAVG